MLLAPEADLRTDLPKYRIYVNGELIDEPTDITKYWQSNLVSFLLGCSRSFVWAMRSVQLSWREYGPYRSTIPCVPAGPFHGQMVVTPRAFFDAKSAIRAFKYLHDIPSCMAHQSS